MTEEAWHKITHGNFWENYQKAVADGSIIDPPNWEMAEPLRPLEDTLAVKGETGKAKKVHQL